MQFIKTIVSVALAEPLRSVGFKKAGLEWRRGFAGEAHIVSIQRSDWKREDEEDFTLHVGVLVHDVWRKRWSKAIPQRPKCHDCFPTMNIGTLVTDCTERTSDIWWKVRSSTDVERAAADLKQKVERYVLPFLNDIEGDHGGLLRFTLAHPVLYRFPAERLELAILAHCVNETQVSRELLGSMGRFSDAWSSEARKVAQRLELL